MELDQEAPPGGQTPEKRPRRRRRLAGAVGVTLLIALTLGVSAAAANSPSAAPVGSATIMVGTGPATAVSPADQAKVEAAFTAYRACMKEHGIDLPAPVLVQAGTPGQSTDVTGPVLESGMVLNTEGSPGTVAGPAFDPVAFEAAAKACAPILDAAGIKQSTASAVSGSVSLPAGVAGVVGGAAVVGGGVAGAGDITAMVAPIRKYATCMRDHGVNVPDPTVDENAGTFEMRLDVDPTTAEFKAADTACASDSGFSFAAPTRPAGQ